jgi:hypothetical protein
MQRPSREPPLRQQHADECFRLPSHEKVDLSVSDRPLQAAGRQTVPFEKFPHPDWRVETSFVKKLRLSASRTKPVQDRVMALDHP